MYVCMLMTTDKQQPTSKQNNRDSWFIAFNRFGLGAKLGQIDTVTGTPKHWLLEQIKQPQFNFDPALPSSNDIILRDAKLKKTKGFDEKQKLRVSFFASFNEMVSNSLQQELTTHTGFEWRVLNFFSNHFSVTKDDYLSAGLAPTLEREAIAPHLFGRFEDMLLAVVQHPTMLHYLDNVNSFGPNSIIGKNRNKGLNENLAREILELHTMGVNGGYTQADVIALAKGITGWSVGNPNKKEKPTFVYRERGHEPGNFVLLNTTHKQDGIAQGTRMLSQICNHPSTAHYICTKIAKHFVSSTPSNALVQHLTNTWTQSNGHLAQVFSALIQHEDSWKPTKAKFKTPHDYIISTVRALPKNLWPTPNKLRKTMEMFGHGPFMAGSPAGYEDSEEYWNTPSAILNRVDWVYQLVANFNDDITPVFNSLDMSFANSETYNVIAGADTRQNALLLYFANPDFMRR